MFIVVNARFEVLLLPSGSILESKPKCASSQVDSPRDLGQQGAVHNHKVNELVVTLV